MSMVFLADLLNLGIALRPGCTGKLGLPMHTSDFPSSEHIHILAITASGRQVWNNVPVHLCQAD